MRFPLYSDEFIIPIVVRCECSSVDATGIKANSIFSINRVVMNGVAEKDAVRPVVVIIPERSVIPVPVRGTHRQQLINGVVFKLSLRIDTAMHNKYVVERDGNRK